MQAHVDSSQDHYELKSFLKFVRQEGIKRYCEIGCRNGNTFFYVMRAIGVLGWGAAVDLPKNTSSMNNLNAVISELVEELGYRGVFRYWGNSQRADTIRWVHQRGPFDLIFIDADHSFQGVERDFRVYSDIAKFVAFHDISAQDDHMADGKPCEVGKFWRILKAREHIDNKYSILQEIITPNSQMGIGILEMKR